jgi:splicing factor 3A subunit 3
LQQREAGGFKADDDEEYEDEEGNVFNRKVYTDLQRQGLL